ncbi:indolepyruvate oxidoreductase subunit beta, partial [candidate division WOR-3 bacterium]|nr:indolepyruvate oxidoreductase subunit beta [candidate division WOR-3 bacterium]
MNLLVCGVGGQGVLLFSDIISELALASGLDVKKSEVHGMAQRGGSVTSHIRYGSKVHSPLIEEGSADLLVAFEMLEALRYVHFLAPGARLLYDPHRIDPLPVSIGLVERPSDAQLEERLAARASLRHAFPAWDTAVKLGSARVQNVVMLGAVSRLLAFPLPSYEMVMTRLVKAQALEL